MLWIEGDHSCMENKLSVCIFVYNHQKYIKKCIDSVLDQKVTFPFKIYAFEDFSTDRTREILDKVTDNRCCPAN